MGHVSADFTICWCNPVHDQILVFRRYRGHVPHMTNPLPIRLPWPPDFPDVVIHTDVRTRDSHPNYRAAKAGDADAALSLASDLLSPDGIARLRLIVGRRPALLLPVVADELMGFNAIPDAVAQILGNELGITVVAGEIVQTNKVGHTRAPAFQRLVTPATFEGQVQAGANYVLVDDHVGLGGTLANLRGYVEAHGGTVIAITTLTESRDARVISLRPYTRNMLWERHCQALDAKGSTASRKSKPSTYVVSNPLPASRISWLRQQSRHVAEVSRQRLNQATDC